MTILLAGSLHAEEHAGWQTHLPADEELVLATEPHDASRVDVALVANGTLQDRGRLLRLG